MGELKGPKPAGHLVEAEKVGDDDEQKRDEAEDGELRLEAAKQTEPFWVVVQRVVEAMKHLFKGHCEDNDSHETDTNLRRVHIMLEN